MYSEPEKIRLIAGLGNPGPEYAGTRHNVGFAFIERFLAKMPGRPERIHAFNSYCWKCTYAGERLFLQTPLTYMNLSGSAVRGLAASERIAPEQVLVVHDDMDLAPGRIRIRANGSSGGHNGINSIIGELGTQNFPRVRIGIGRMTDGHGSADYVLSAFSEEEKVLMDKVLDLAADAVVLALRRGLPAAMTRYNRVDLAEPETGDDSKQEQNTDIQQKQQNTPQEV